jgi:hypothetical protein
MLHCTIFVRTTATLLGNSLAAHADEIQGHPM